MSEAPGPEPRDAAAPHGASAAAEEPAEQQAPVRMPERLHEQGSGRRPDPSDAWPPPADEAPWHQPAPDGGDLFADLSDDAAQHPPHAAPDQRPDQPPEVWAGPFHRPDDSPAQDADVGGPVPPPLPPPLLPGAVVAGAADVGVRRQPARRRRAALLLTVGAVALAAGGAGGAAGAYLVEQQRSTTLVDPGVRLPAPEPGSTARAADSLAGIVAAVAPSVVTLKVSGGGQQGTGSGFVLDDRGYVLTNNHVVAAAAASGGRVRVFFSDGRQADATIVGRDVSYDLAVVKTDVRGLRALPLADSDGVLVGDAVLAVGAPLGLRGTVTQGIISARNRPVAAGQASETSFINALQTDAAINPGNSGGPLLDLRGRVVGVNAAIARIPGSGLVDTTGGNIGLGFAIPSNQARRTAEQLIRTGKAQHPVIGALLDEDDSDDGVGVRIARGPNGGRPALTPGGPAETAGIKPGDIVLAVDGQPVSSGPELVVAIRAHNPGDTVRLTVRTGQVTRTVPVRLAAADG